MTREEEINIAAQCTRIDIALKLSHYTDSIDKIDDIKEKLSFDEIAEGAFIEGVKWSDENPKSPWISVKDDLPCNHEELLSKDKEGYTELVLVYTNIGVIFIPMRKYNNGWRWTTSGYFPAVIITHWMPIPEFPKE